MPRGPLQRLPRDLLSSSGTEILPGHHRRPCSETLHRDPLQRSCQEVSYRNLAENAFAESLYRDLIKRSCREISVTYLVQRSCQETCWRDLCRESSHRDLVHRSCRETSYRNLVQRPREESRGPARRSCIHSLNRDLTLRSLTKIFCGDLL